MKVNVEVDCTPEEARTFLGLPDVAPMQQRLIERMEKRLADAVSGLDAKALMDQWMPLSIKGFEQWQNLWAQLAASAGNMARKPSKE